MCVFKLKHTTHLVSISKIMFSRLLEILMQRFNDCTCMPAIESSAYLRYDGEFRAQVMKTQFCDVNPVNDYLSTRRLNDAKQGKSEGRLSRSCASHDADLGTTYNSSITKGSKGLCKV